MSTTITVEQIRTLWDSANPNATIDRGDDFEPVTKDDLGALASELDTDDDGYPLADQWQLLADQLNGETPGEPTSTTGDDILQEIREARAERDRVKSAADDQFNAVIRAAVASKMAPVIAIADAADMSRARIYQIRDGRR
ncbi:MULTISPECIES: hypothetical protein [Actinomycetes]|uniref:hypothetical protein n=1 Tax=Actinomycetes TaxID=1760 RepID=UPI0019070046|nr:hypothetical protein [Streptomyces sp. XC 2026]QQN79696.1 hypothetical protein IPZ77_21440 [Streptomyces sp. XC 2026]QQN80606.1 hypothetical protein IPZ77_26735 [Streptomyces sp. XC 2026]